MLCRTAKLRFGRVFVDLIDFMQHACIRLCTVMCDCPCMRKVFVVIKKSLVGLIAPLS